MKSEHALKIVALVGMWLGIAVGAANGHDYIGWGMFVSFLVVMG